MPEYTNCWLLIEKNLANSWQKWWSWHNEGRQGLEPNIHEWDKARIKGMVDASFAFHAFDPPKYWEGREWRLFSIYGVSKDDIKEGISLHGDALEGGNFNVVGYWTWTDRKQQRSEQVRRKQYRPDIVGLFMKEDASDISDINLLAGQPPRDLSPSALAPGRGNGPRKPVPRPIFKRRRRKVT